MLTTGGDVEFSISWFCRFKSARVLIAGRISAGSSSLLRRLIRKRRQRKSGKRPSWECGALERSGQTLVRRRLMNLNQSAPPSPFNDRHLPNLSPPRMSLVGFSQGNADHLGSSTGSLWQCLRRCRPAEAFRFKLDLVNPAVIALVGRQGWYRRNMGQGLCNFWLIALSSSVKSHGLILILQ
jgi:hypothetical protein